MWAYLIMKDGIPSQPGLKGLGNFIASLPSAVERGTMQGRSL